MKTILYILVGFITIVSCNESKNKNLTLEDIQKIKEQSIEINKAIVKQKSDTIQAFLNKNNLHFSKTNTGLYYSISSSGNTDSIKTGDLIQYTYSISLLDGTKCYSSDSLGAKTVKVGQAGVESGLEEAFLLMHKGDTAHLIIPPHLAHGLQGDLQKIPPYAILDYTVIITHHKKAENL